MVAVGHTLSTYDFLLPPGIKGLMLSSIMQQLTTIKHTDADVSILVSLLLTAALNCKFFI